MGALLQFRESQNPGRVTRVWAVAPARGGVLLGEVRWFAPWRRYCFYPADGRLFDGLCLAELARFLVDQTHARETARRGRMSAASTG